MVTEAFRDTEDLDGLFSGYDPETASYDAASWQYEGMEQAHANGGLTGPEAKEMAVGLQAMGWALSLAVLPAVARALSRN